MTAALRAGALYFVVIFALGFALGTLRILVLVPRFDETIAVLLEMPIILSASWLISRALIRRLGVDAKAPARVTMGAFAFALLISAEQLLGIFVFGRDLGELFFHYQTSAGIIGLAGQIAFALIPVIQLLVENRE